MPVIALSQTVRDEHLVTDKLIFCPTAGISTNHGLWSKRHILRGWPAASAQGRAIPKIATQTARQSDLMPLPDIRSWFIV